MKRTPAADHVPVIAPISEVAERDKRSSARQRIVAAAADQIAREGADGLRVDTIAADLGISRTLVFYHFRSRNALLAAALERCFEVVITGREPAAAAPPTATARLSDMVERCLPVPGVQRREWTLWMEVWYAALRDPALAGTAARLYARQVDWFTETIRSGMASGEFPPAQPRLIAERLSAIIDGFGLRALLGDPAVSTDRVRSEAWHYLTTALGQAPPES
jgi:AcrR family transcriptional regulator